MQGNETIPISVYIITLNEADKIHRLLSQLCEFKEVIVVDCGSTDSTPEIARKFSNVKFSHRDWSGFSNQKSHALSLCSCEWVLNLDADEELTFGYIDELKSTIKDDGCLALESKRILYRWGRKPNPFARDDRIIRLFKKKYGHYEPIRVHECISITGKIRKTNAFIIHHENLTFDERVQKSNVYSQLKAMDKFENGNRCNVFTLFVIFPWSFIQCYLLKGNILDGSRGLLTSMNIAYYSFMKYAKLWEMENQQETEIKAFNPVTKKQPQLCAKNPGNTQYSSNKLVKLNAAVHQKRELPPSSARPDDSSRVA